MHFGTLKLFTRFRYVCWWKLKNIHRNKWNGGCIDSELQKCFRILNLNESSNVAEIRASYIELAKRYHPDSGSPVADAQKFADVKEAYKILIRRSGEGTKREEDYELEDEKDFDIKHTAPQHRQFLSYEGVGYGNMNQRHKQFQNYKISKAVDAVFEHRTKQLTNENQSSLVSKDKKEAKKHKIRNAIDRLVEDLIQESMAKGDFENLPGKGKPLQYSTSNPYIDTVTQKLNEVLITNGFVPQWILLEKEIRQDIGALRERLKTVRCQFSPLPLDATELNEWSKQIATLQNDVKSLNTKINNYNLLVPLLEKQFVNVSLDKEANKVLESGKTKYDSAGSSDQKSASWKQSSNDQGGLLKLLFEVFR